MAGKRTERAKRTRQAMLEAGLAILRDVPTDHLFERLQAQAVSARAGVTTGSFYHHFDGQDGFVAALLEYALAKDHNPPFAEAVKAFEQQLGASASFLDALTASCTHLMDWQQGNPTFALQLAVTAKSHRDPALAKRLDRMYRQVEEEMNGYFQAILTLLGREMRPPLAIGDLTGTIMAMFEGLSIRRAVSPAAIPPGRLATVIIPTVLVMTRELDDTATVADWLERHAPRWKGGEEQEQVIND
jgi:AcrR family transcriptional regulator